MTLCPSRYFPICCAVVLGSVSLLAPSFQRTDQQRWDWPVRRATRARAGAPRRAAPLTGGTKCQHGRHCDRRHGRRHGRQGERRHEHWWDSNRWFQHGRKRDRRKPPTRWDRDGRQKLVANRDTAGLPREGRQPAAKLRAERLPAAKASGRNGDGGKAFGRNGYRRHGYGAAGTGAGAVRARSTLGLSIAPHRLRLPWTNTGQSPQPTSLANDCSGVAGSYIDRWWPSSTVPGRTLW